MIKIIAEFFVKPESVDAVVEFAKELVAETKKEAGCIAYNLFSDDTDNTHVIIIEEWASQEVLDIHSASAHFTRLVPAIVDLCAKAPAIRTYTKIV